MLNWTKTANGYEAHGVSGRVFHILRHGSRFRYANGDNKEPVGTLTSLKTLCEDVNEKDQAAAEIVTTKNATNLQDKPKCPSCGRGFTADGKCHYCTAPSLPVNNLSGPGDDTNSVLNSKPKATGGQHGGPVVSKKEEEESAKILTDMNAKPAAKPEAKPATATTISNLFRNNPNQTADTSPHVIIEARAGTGKTTTLVQALRWMTNNWQCSCRGQAGIDSYGIPKCRLCISGSGNVRKLEPSPQQKAVYDAVCLSAGKARSVAFVAFNKSIAEELQQRVPAGVNASTMHSMGFKAIREAYGNVKVDEYRVQGIISELLNTDIRELRRHQNELIQATERLVGLCKMNLSSSDLDSQYSGEWDAVLDQLASYYEIELAGHRQKVFELVPRVIARCKSVSDDMSIDYNDMIWIPVVNDLPLYRYDLLLVDEAQDLNRCQQSLAMKASRRLILCGDPKQAIYGFAGADSESMPRMLKQLEATTRGCFHLPLTVTRRCGKAIVEEARKIVKDFGAFETNPEGKIDYSSMAKYGATAGNGDMILCRVNAPLVSECFAFIKQGRKATIQGRDIAKGLISTVVKLKANDTVDLSSKLSDWLANETRKEQAKRNPSETRLIGLQDRYDCLCCFIEGSTTVEQVIQKIEAIFTDNKESTGIRLSSIHKAKGLEAGRVFLLEPKGATVPHPMAKTDWQREQEWNLRYVAITRAINELVFVREEAK